MPDAVSPVDLSILVVSYNTRAITLECLESLYRHPPSVRYEVIVVDNDSRDGSAEAIAAAFPQARLIAAKENLGFGGGNNLAAQYASGRRLLLLNPDTIVFERTFDAVWEFAEREPLRGIWGGRTLHKDGSLNPPSCWRDLSLWGLATQAVGLQHFFPENEFISWEDYGGWQRDRERAVDIVAGCFLLIDTELPSMTEPIPNDRNHLHFGAGETEARVELPPGTHTLQLLLGDKDHVPHKPPVQSKKITITVR